MLNEKYNLNRYIQKNFKIKKLFCQISNTLSITVIQTIILPATKFENTVLYHKKFGKNNRPLIKSILDTMGCEKDTCTWKSNRNLYMCSLESIQTGTSHYLYSFFVTIRLLSVGKHLPQCDTKTPHICLMVELPIIDTFWCIPITEITKT